MPGKKTHEHVVVAVFEFTLAPRGGCVGSDRESDLNIPDVANARAINQAPHIELRSRCATKDDDVGSLALFYAFTLCAHRIKRGFDAMARSLRKRCVDTRNQLFRGTRCEHDDVGSPRG